MKRWDPKNPGWQRLFSTLVFLVFIVTIGPARKVLGDGSMAFSLIPVIVVTWFFGLRVGLLSVLAVLLFESWIIIALESKRLVDVMNEGGWAGMITTVLIAVLISYFRGLHQRLQQELAEREKAEASLARESSINAALAELSHALVCKTSLDDFPGLVLEHAARLTGSDVGLVGFLDFQTGRLVSAQLGKVFCEPGRTAGKEIQFQEPEGLWSWVLSNKLPLILNQFGRDSKTAGYPQGAVPIRRFLSVPAIVDGILVGQISVANSPRDYSYEDLTVVQKLATLYGVAVYQHQLKEKYLFLSLHDPLTGLSNRRFLEEEIQRLQNRNVYPHSILFCDLDRLKDVNDQGGHSAGDLLIRRAADLLRSAFRAGDVVARLGGDEFVILLPDASKEAAAQAVLRVRQVIDHYNHARVAPTVSLSIGSATVENGMDWPGAIDRADSAMYLDKMTRRAMISHSDCLSFLQNSQA